MTRRSVPVTVHVPSGTPGTVYVVTMPFDDYVVDQRVALVAHGDVWTGTVDVEVGALVRYVYDRWDGETPIADMKDLREASGSATRIENRYAIATPDLIALDDVVETWQDRRDLRAPVGDLTGIVRDEAGAPIIDALVSAGGVHTATAYDGTFMISDLALGTQRVVVTTTLGDHRPVQTEVVGSDASIVMTPAAPVMVWFDATLPAATPADAEVRIVGNVYATGARPFRTSPNHAGPLSAPVTDRSIPGHARIALPMFEGTYVQYVYTIGGDGLGAEVRDRPRSFVVDANSNRDDHVESWVPDGGHLVAIHVTPPADTGTTPIAISYGPSNWVTADTHAFYFHAYPGEQLHYQYVLGDDQRGHDAAGMRTLVMGDHDLAIADVVERWEGSPVGSAATVTFRAAMPPTTGAARVVGTGALAAGVPLVAMPGEPGQRAVTVAMPSGPVTYHYEGDGGVSRTFTWTPPYGGAVVDDAVPAWSTAPLPAGGTRPEFVTGAYMPDFWSPSFAALSAPTFDRMRQHGIGWVAVSSVWSYGQIQPLPTIESRPRYAETVATPREDLRMQIATAHAHGLHVILAPQFNMEMSPGGMDALNAPKSPAWWEAWLGLAEKLWMWNATLAEDTGAEALVLPGPVFHVFFQSGSYETAEYEHTFDQHVRALIARVRTVYHGKIVMSGGVPSFDFPGDADYVGFTTYDLGRPALPYDASADTWAAAYETLFAGRVDAIFARWSKPVLAYTVALQPDPLDPDATSEDTQSRQLDGITRAITARPFVAGMLSWSYQMIDAPHNPDDGVRGHAAEGMLDRVYETFVAP